MAGRNKNVFRIDLFGVALNVGGGRSDRPASIFSRASCNYCIFQHLHFTASEFLRPDGIGRASTRHIRNNQLWRFTMHRPSFRGVATALSGNLPRPGLGTVVFWRTASYRVYPSLTCACARSSPDRAAGDGGCSQRGSVLERERGDDDQDDERHGDQADRRYQLRFRRHDVLSPARRDQRQSANFATGRTSSCGASRKRSSSTRCRRSPP